MLLPKITSKQQEILEHLYRYRFLNRIQIQALLHHKDKRRIISWLKDLREKDFVEWIYSTDFIEKTKPAIYYVGINGIRFLRSLKDDDNSPVYPFEELRKRYRESSRSLTFIDRSVLVADCCLALEILNESNNGDTDATGSSYTSTPKNHVHYTCTTEADYIDPNHDVHFLAEHEKLRPNLCIVKQKGQTNTNYLLEIFDATLPHYRLRNRFKAYITYLTDNEWEGDKPLPIILLVLPNLNELIYAKRCVRKLLLDIYYEVAEIDEDIHIRFMTIEQIRRAGITAPLWEEGRKRAGL